MEEDGARPRNRDRIRLILLFSLLGFIGGLAVVPYATAVLGDQVRAAGVPLWTVAISSAVQSTVFAAAAALVGVLSLERAGLDVPYFRALVTRRRLEGRDHLRSAVVAALLGGLAAILIFVLDVSVFSGLGGSEGGQLSGTPPLLLGLLASLYGGIVEEILLRLGLMTGLAALLTLVPRHDTATRMWLAIVVAAILFGLGHLPITAALVPLTGAVVLRALMLNGIGGVLFGWLYWKQGLLMAMVAHLSADIVLQSMGNLLG